ncbi:MAG TPA: pitrilysin family protein [Candidatus Sulfotelmatobacter sp.]|jgi:predicted Zn-dependent peptidase|nr:pitrilysin family protein [Candidatus Sulfotelmatobacter sp.]
MTYTRKVLANGLRVLTVSMPSFESATVLVMAGAGSRYETRKNSGISHFLEHMAFKGTEKRPSAMIISSLIDGMGGEFNAFTGKETTGYYIKSSKEKVETSLDVLSDMLLNSKFDPLEIEKEKGVIIEEINLYEDMPARKIGDIYEQLLYGDTPMGWDIAGSKEVIRSITRDDFISYLAELYSASNLTVVVAGGIDSDETVTLVEKYFSHMKQFQTKEFEPLNEQQDKPAILIKQKQTEQIHIALGVRTVSINSSKRYPLSVLAAILGGGMSSRLFHEIREKRGLAYYVRSNADEYIDAGTFVSTAGIDPKRIIEAVEVMVAEYSKVARGELGLTDEELAKAKEFLKGHLVLDLEDSRSVSGYYAHQELLEEKIQNPDEVLSDIDNVTKEDVELVGKEFFKEQTLNLAVIGKFEDGQKLESLLKL